MTAKRLTAVILIFILTAIAWMILGTSIIARTEQGETLGGSAVEKLWGEPQRQSAPEMSYRVVKAEKKWDSKGKAYTENVASVISVNPESSDIKTKINLEHRKKGLLWFSTYKVDFHGSYLIRNPDSKTRTFTVQFNLPTSRAIYDDYQFMVGGKQINALETIDQGLRTSFYIAPGQVMPVIVKYKSQGLDKWYYVFGDSMKNIKNFNMQMVTNFNDIDFPDDGMSPTVKTKNKGIGWTLDWKFKNLISGYQIGILMPNKINPGPLASKISYFAPVPLLFFFTILVITSTIMKKRIHPLNFLFLSGAFFAFHLLFAYLVDHIDIYAAFLISSLISLLLTFTYLRLFTDNRFALLQGAFSQLIFLVLFSYSFFFEGYTGLAVTIGSILTLAVMMQITGKIDWYELMKEEKEELKIRQSMVSS